METCAVNYLDSDKRSYRILTIAFAAMTAVVYFLSISAGVVPCMLMTGMFLAITVLLECGWFYTGYPGMPAEARLTLQWKNYLHERFLKHFTQIMFLVFISANLMEQPVARRTQGELPRNSAPIVVPESRDRLQPPAFINPECPRDAFYTTARGEIFQCAYAKPTVEGGACAPEHGIDGRTCLSDNAPGNYIVEIFWCEGGELHAAVVYNTQNGVIECAADLVDPNICSEEDIRLGGPRFCVNYDACRPMQSHTNDGSCGIR